MNDDRANELFNSGMTRREMSRRIASLESLHLPGLKRSHVDPDKYAVIPVGHVQCLEHQLADVAGSIESGLQWLKDFQKASKDD